MRAVVDAAGLAGVANTTLITFGLFSMVVAAVFIIGQADFKRMLAYSSVEHMGILSLGVGLDIVHETIRSQNGTVRIESELGVGFRNAGTLAIRDGLTISSSSGMLGMLPGSAAVATVSGQGTSWTTADLFVASRGTATLNILGGATVRSTTATIKRLMTAPTTRATTPSRARAGGS